MNIDSKLQIIASYHDKLLQRYHSLGTTIAQLTANGCIDAKEHWKDGKYLCLLYKMNRVNLPSSSHKTIPASYI